MTFCRAHGAAQCRTCQPVTIIGALTAPHKNQQIKPVGRQMNKTETRYASTVLDPLRLAGEIVSYQYEAATLKLGPDLRYTPDFLVIPMPTVAIGIFNSTSSVQCAPIVEFHEVKGGFTRDDALVKIKAAAQQFPHFVFKLCRYQKGQWDIRVIG